jgi:predicted dehydrogenase
MNHPVRIGFIGAGRMGQMAHLRNYASLPDCEVVALAELRPQLAQRVARRYGIPRVYADARQMLAEERLDGVVASQQFNHHGRILPPVYEAGIPVFTEKPLAASVEVAEQLVAALSKSRAFHMVGYHKRSDPAVIYAQQEIAQLRNSGQIGRMTYVRILMPAGDWVAGGCDEELRSDEPFGAEIRADPPAADMDAETFEKYVTFVNFYIHQVNLMRHLLGEPYRVTYADPSGVMLAVQSASGIAGVIEMTPYRTSLDWQESALVAFERGYVKIELPAPLALTRPGRVEIMKDAGDGGTPTTLVPTLPHVHAMRQQAMNFLRAIRGEAPPPCDAVEALEDLRFAERYIERMDGQ